MANENNKKNCYKCQQEFPEKDLVQYSGSIMCKPCCKKHTEFSWGASGMLMLVVISAIAGICLFMKWLIKDENE